MSVMLASANRTPAGAVRALVSQLVIALVVLTGCSACKRSRPAPESAPTTDYYPLRVQGKVGWHTFRVELAVTPQDQARGLMYRSSMRKDVGMLFIFRSDSVKQFYMKDTYIPLDMIFVDKEGIVVGVVHRATPHTTTTRSVGVPSRYVLELNGGLARRLGIDKGKKVDLSTIPFR